jgi:DNA polymerase III epsilon subunit-like protein
MQTLYMDIECDGWDPTVIHQISTIDEAGESASYNHERGNMAKGLQALSQADVLIGHNIIAFDLVALESVYTDFSTQAHVVDTLVCSRLAWPHLKDLDYKKSGFPKEHIGSHSLQAWGERLGFAKYSYGEGLEDPWLRWTPEMEAYCHRDVEVCRRLHRAYLEEEVPRGVLEMEHGIHSLMVAATSYGWLFDRRAADKLYVRLLAKRDQLEAELQDLFPPREVVLKTKTKLVPFNPGSRQQIADRFVEQGWKPQEFTPEGRPKISETVLDELSSTYSEAATLNDYLLIQKRVGQLAEGQSSWLGLVEDDDRIRGRTITCGGTISHRMVHFAPNVSACPNSGSVYGKELRALWRVPEGCRLVGTDLASAELRLLAHMLAYWDDGRFARLCEEGDPHQENADRLRISRSEAKRVQFALIYGAGDQLLGDCVGGSRRDGSDVRHRFHQAHPAFPKLVSSIQSKTKELGFLTGLDGRKLYPRSQRTALNLWVQNATVTCAKRAALQHCSSLVQQERLALGSDFMILGHFHDEWQIEVKEEHAEAVAAAALPAIRLTGEMYDLNVRLDGDTTIGKNWSETH